METPFIRAHQADTSRKESVNSCSLVRKINSDRDVIQFKQASPAYRNIQAYIESLCNLIQGTGYKVLNHKYTLKHELFDKLAKFFKHLEELCDKTDLTQTKSAGTLRFGHVAFRDWYDVMKGQCENFINTDLAPNSDELLREELITYLSESFGNRMRIDYGTGHELNFILFTMGLSLVIESIPSGDEQTLSINPPELTPDVLRQYVIRHGWDIHSLFAHKYLRLCRAVQKKFRLEPAGSRGVYNMDDFQFLPFLFGVAQLVDTKYVSCKNFDDPDQVELWKSDLIFFEAIDHILKNKRGPFNEHSYTLWCFQSLGSWSAIYSKIKAKFIDDVLSPFPILQHLLFGRNVLKWE